MQTTQFDNRKKLITVAGIAAVMVFGGASASGQNSSSKDDGLLAESARTFTRVARETIPAVVFIEVEKKVTGGGGMAGPFGSNDLYQFFGDDLLRKFFRDPRFRRGPQQDRGREYIRRGQGSGFIVDKKGYILSNSHVVGEADKITVHLHDGRELEAELVGTDPESEVAVIKIAKEKGKGSFPAIGLGDSSKLQIGEWVVAIGNPFGLSETLTVGVVSARGRSNLGIANYENFIQTDAAINPGNSGGPLLNIDGEAIGINTAIYSRSGGYMGIGFAIPSKMARDIMNQLIETGRVERGFLGVVIQPVTQELAEAFGLDEVRGIIISEVSEDSPADGAGLKQGDVIVELNDRKVKNAGSFRNAIAATPPGKTVTLVVRRDGKRKSIDVKLGRRQSAQLAKGGEPGSSGRLGFEVKELTEDLAGRFGYTGEEGVLISQVMRGSEAARAGLEPGQLITEVNREPVSSVKEFKAALSDAEEPGTLLLLVKDGEMSRFVTLPLD